VQLLVAVVHESQYDVKREAAFAIYNLASYREPDGGGASSDGPNGVAAQPVGVGGPGAAGGQQVQQQGQQQGQLGQGQILDELVARGMVEPALEMVAASNADLQVQYCTIHYTMYSLCTADLQLVGRSLFFVETILRAPPHSATSSATAGSATAGSAAGTVGSSTAGSAAGVGFHGVRVVEECGGIEFLEQLQYSTAIGNSAEVRACEGSDL
jgi:hypothetical protein